MSRMIVVLLLVVVAVPTAMEAETSDERNRRMAQARRESEKNPWYCDPVKLKAAAPHIRRMVEATFACASPVRRVQAQEDGDVPYTPPRRERAPQQFAAPPAPAVTPTPPVVTPTPRPAVVEPAVPVHIPAAPSAVWFAVKIVTLAMLAGFCFSRALAK